MRGAQLALALASMNAQPHTIEDWPLIDSLATAVLCVDDGLRIRFLNSAAEQLLGFSSRKALQMRLTRAVNISDTLFARIREAIATGQPYTDRQVSIEPHGQEAILVDCHLSPVNTRKLGRGLILEINAVDRPMRIARDEALLTQQEHAQSLIRGLAHEIKNPLGGLRGAAQLLERELPDESLHEYTSIIIREADRLQTLIDRMLGPTTRPKRDASNLHEILEHVRKIALAGAPSGVQLKFDYDPSIPECLTDRDRLVQVLLNIVGNALQAVGNAGTIYFRSRVAHNYTITGTRHPLVVAIQIKDNGPGIPDDLLDQIFYPMVTGSAQGTGLGLSIAQSMMNQIGGLIECQSEPGDTTFTILIPLEIA